MTTFEKGCYYATTTRDVSTMNVFFIDVIDMYADTIMYRIVPQTLHCSLDRTTAEKRLQDADINVSSVFTDTCGLFFQACGAVIYSSLMMQLK
jgi:hypothetical protein